MVDKIIERKFFVPQPPPPPPPPPLPRENPRSAPEFAFYSDLNYYAVYDYIVELRYIVDQIRLRTRKVCFFQVSRLLEIETHQITSATLLDPRISIEGRTILDSQT